MVIASANAIPMHDPVLNGLAKRRAELVAEVKRTEAVLRGLLADIDHLDATTRQFDPDHRPSRPGTSIGRLDRGSTTKTLLTILRTAPGPMTVRDLIRAIMAARGANLEDRKLVNRTAEQVRVAFARQRKNGTVTAEPGPKVGVPQVWLWRIAM